MKESIRNSLIKMRKSIKKEKIQETSKLISKSVDKILSEKIKSKKSVSLGIYYPIYNEIDCISIIQNIERIHPLKMQYYFPLITNFEKSEMRFVKIKNNEIFNENFVKIQFGFEPKNYELNNDNIDVVLVPLVGFDSNNRRIGMGKGFYDRWFARNLNSLKIGLAFEFQKMDFYDSSIFNSFDIPLDIIVTDCKVYYK